MLPHPRSRQQPLFTDPPTSPPVRLLPDVQEQLRHALVQWLRTVGTAIAEEGADDGDQR
jgi:hypothetical protein